MINKEIMNTAIATIKAKPELMQYMTGSGRWLAEIVTCKMGDPNEKERMKDEHKLKSNISKFLESQFLRVQHEIKKDSYRKSVYQQSFWDDEKDKMWSELAGDFVGILLRGVEEGIAALGGYGASVDMDDLNQYLITYANDYRNQWLSYITNTSRKAVQEAVTKWLQSNESFDSLVTMLENTFSDVRAARIAATEVTRLRAKANSVAWEQSGVVKQFRWSTANDDLVCEICGPREGQLFPLNQMALMLPAHVNCRCVGMPVVDEESHRQQIEQILGL
jgi:SPP1 gp7 family putative phage head morphogenesis protein